MGLKRFPQVSSNNCESYLQINFQGAIPYLKCLTNVTKIRNDVKIKKIGFYLKNAKKNCKLENFSPFLKKNIAKNLPNFCRNWTELFVRWGGGQRTFGGGRRKTNENKREEEGSENALC